MTRKSYSTEFKQIAVDKVYQRQGRTIADIALDLNVNHTTLKSWTKQTKQQQNKPTPIAKRPEDWTLEASLLALPQSHALSEPALSAWCREHGIFTHHLE